MPKSFDFSGCPSPVYIARLDGSRYCEGDARRVKSLIATESVVAIATKSGRIKYLQMLVDEATANGHIEAFNRQKELEGSPISSNSYRDVSVSFAAYAERVDQERDRIMRGCAGSHSSSEWAEIVRKYGNKCLRCGVSGAEAPLTKDHIVAVAGGGTNYASNLQPLCVSCNSWKGKRDIDFRLAIAAAA